MRKVLITLTTLVFLILVSCSNGLSGEEKVATEFIKSKDYKIVKSLGEPYRYTLTKDMLAGKTASGGAIQSWCVQSSKPEDYFNKEITTYSYEVTNHPMQKNDSNAKNGVWLNIMMCEGKVIGGTSTPNVDTVGGVFSLEGKTLEEVTGISYKEWQDKWREKYSK
ncbi:MAG: DUF4830 domain-containing protein [Clostridium sp.]|uniref:DUF4830 domain-containing protein n=1 Tax=Clostridium sp. TaxID=1506 RepID=UPI002FCB8C23